MIKKLMIGIWGAVVAFEIALWVALAIERL